MPSISRSKGNQTLKFGQLIECNMGNIFLEKSHRMWRRNAFLKTKNWAYLWINSLKFYTVCFYCMASWGLLKYIETKMQTNYFHLILSLLKKIKRGLELVILPHFPHNVWRKIFLVLCSISWPNFSVWLPLICEILGNICVGNVCEPGCDVMHFEVNLIFLIKLFFLHDPNVVTKT